jgi:hypothetical protein
MGGRVALRRMCATVLSWQDPLSFPGVPRPSVPSPTPLCSDGAVLRAERPAQVQGVAAAAGRGDDRGQGGAGVHPPVPLQRAEGGHDAGRAPASSWQAAKPLAGRPRHELQRHDAADVGRGQEAPDGGRRVAQPHGPPEGDVGQERQERHDRGRAGATSPVFRGGGSGGTRCFLLESLGARGLGEGCHDHQASGVQWSKGGGATPQACVGLHAGRQSCPFRPSSHVRSPSPCRTAG